MNKGVAVYVFVLALVVAVVVSGCTGQAQQKPEQKAAYKDGEYTGKHESDKGDTEVKVTVKDGRIHNIEIVKPDAQFAIDDNWPAHIVAREQIPQRIIAEQSPRVDSVSKATGTSTGLMEATEDALSKAK